MRSSSSSALIVIVIGAYDRQGQETRGTGRARNRGKGTRRLEGKEAGQVRLGALIAKVQKAFGNAVVLFDEPNNAAEVMMVVIDLPGGSKCRNHDHGDAESQLVASERRRQNLGHLVVIPPSPVVPGNEDGRCIPIAAAVRVLAFAGADGVDQRRYPGRATAVVGPGMIGIRRRGT